MRATRTPGSPVDSLAERPAEPSPARGRDPDATKERLLDAAEALFAELGFEGTSMRAVTSAAGVSVSAANYHFGSKEALLRATLWRVIEPLNRERLARLDALEEAAAGAPVALEDVLDAFLRPALVGAASGAGRAELRQVAARLFSDPPELVSALKREYFGEQMARFGAALARALPGCDPDELAMAFQFTIAMMVHVISGQLETFEPERAEALAGAHVDVPQDEILRRMIRYAAAGLSAVTRLPQESK